jgi:hypothetical protein
MPVVEVSTVNVRRDVSKVCRACCSLPLLVLGLNCSCSSVWRGALQTLSVRMVGVRAEPYRDSQSGWSVSGQSPTETLSQDGRCQGRALQRLSVRMVGVRAEPNRDSQSGWSVAGQRFENETSYLRYWCACHTANIGGPVRSSIRSLRYTNGENRPVGP